MFFHLHLYNVNSTCISVSNFVLMFFKNSAVKRECNIFKGDRNLINGVGALFLLDTLCYAGIIHVPYAFIFLFVWLLS